MVEITISTAFIICLIYLIDNVQIYRKIAIYLDIWLGLHIISAGRFGIPQEFILACRGYIELHLDLLNVCSGIRGKDSNQHMIKFSHI